MGEPIPFNEFKKLDLRVVKVVEATDHPIADKLIVLKVDIGGGETRQIVSPPAARQPPRAPFVARDAGSLKDVTAGKQAPLPGEFGIRLPCRDLHSAGVASRSCGLRRFCG